MLATNRTYFLTSFVGVIEWSRLVLAVAFGDRLLRDRVLSRYRLLHEGYFLEGKMGWGLVGYGFRGRDLVGYAAPA